MAENRLLRRIGTTIRDKWTLERLLGSGGMAAVYVGMHRIGRRDAIKILHREAAHSKELRERFEREAHAANRFRHPGAVEIRDVDVTEDGAPFLVMELLVGESLAERVMRRGGISPRELLEYIDQVLDTLVAAHDRGIVHRDIKPGNLFVVEDGPIKVLDFGVARIRQEGGMQKTWTDKGMALGTIPYMAPEQARGHPIDARADLFSVSATMFRLLAGRHIHDASNEFDLLMKMGNEPAPPLARMTRGVPRDVCLVVDRALAFDREQRYPEARMMLDDVRALRRGERPRHAVMLAGDTDREALTPFGGKAAEPAVPEEPSTSVMIPVEWSESGLSVDVTIKTTTPAAHVEEPSSFESTLPAPGRPPVRR